MANDSEGSSKPQMLNQDGANLSFATKTRSEIFKSDHLETANEAEENADKEEDGSSVKPWAELQCARGNVANIHVIGVIWDFFSCWNVPPDFVTCFCHETWQ